MDRDNRTLPELMADLKRDVDDLWERYQEFAVKYKEREADNGK